MTHPAKTANHNKLASADPISAHSYCVNGWASQYSSYLQQLMDPCLPSRSMQCTRGLYSLTRSFRTSLSTARWRFGLTRITGGGWSINNSRAGLKRSSANSAMDEDALLMGDVESPIISMVALCMHLLGKHLGRVGSATYLKVHQALGSVMQSATVVIYLVIVLMFRNISLPRGKWCTFVGKYFGKVFSRNQWLENNLRNSHYVFFWRDQGRFRVTFSQYNPQQNS